MRSVCVIVCVGGGAVPKLAEADEGAGAGPIVDVVVTTEISYTSVSQPLVLWEIDVLLVTVFIGFEVTVDGVEIVTVEVSCLPTLSTKSLRTAKGLPFPLFPSVMME